MALFSKTKECFISHCSDDVSLVLAIQDGLSACYNAKNIRFFNTSKEDHSSLAGEERSAMIRNALGNSDLMISILTDSYIRSTICLSEINAFWYTQKNVIPIVYSRAASKFLNKLFGVDVIYIDAIDINSLKEESPSNCKSFCNDIATKFVKTMEKFGYTASSSEKAIETFSDIFYNHTQTVAKRPFIGSEVEYENILRYCQEYGISLFRNSSLPWEEMKRKLSEFNNIYILSTTGRSVIHSLSSDFFPEVIKRGANVTILIPNRYSDFIEDVAEIESPAHTKDNSRRLSDEYSAVMNAIERILEIPEVLNSPTRGHIYVGCAHTLLRQTITMGCDGNTAWGWMSMTLPPKKTAEGTPSLEFRGSIHESSMAKIAYEHVNSIIGVAKSRGHFFEITPEMDQVENFYLEKFNAKEEWNQLYQNAKNNTTSKAGDYELIEVAAQHPLKSNGTPGLEFCARLDKGYKLYKEILESGKKAKIYIPGSLHMHKGIKDLVSLSEAGTRYLLEKGVPKEDLLGPEANERYKPDGVYNSADECYVAATIFEMDSYAKLHCVCSSNQLARKKLFYIAFGVIPYFHTVDTELRFHDDIYELMESIPYVLYTDHTWQDKESQRYITSRKERKPE